MSNATIASRRTCAKSPPIPASPATVRDALLRRALEVRPTSRWAAAWLSDASLVALDFRDVEGEVRLAPGTGADVDELVRVARDVDPAIVSWAAGLLRQVTRRQIVDVGDVLGTLGVYLDDESAVRVRPHLGGVLYAVDVYDARVGKTAREIHPSRDDAATAAARATLALLG